jgi:hypothetical protein
MSTDEQSDANDGQSRLTVGLGVWIPITDSLPKSGKPVLVACGKRVLRAAHAAKFALSEDDWGYWNDGDGADYNEANDTTYWPEGWYEWNERELVVSERREHSRKPDEIRDEIVKLCGDVPRVELFCRYPADGWDVWGNEVECTAELGSAV